MYYINYFFIFSILGHIIESLLNKESGILFGYWTPVYGFGVIIILIIHKLLDNKIKSYNKHLKLLILFFCCSITLSIIEALGGYLINWIFDFDMWDYSNFKFNIGKYAAVEMSIVWGISSIIFIYIIKPIVDRFIKKIPKILTYIFICIFFIDIICTIIFK